MNATITINRGELTAIPFSITDAANGLLGKRVTWSLANIRAAGDTTAIAAVLKKASGMGVSSADVTIASIAAGLITGAINLLPADFSTLTGDRYLATLWIDDNAGGDRCVTPGGGADVLVIQLTSPRT
jgi:hypothetical protein